MASISKELLNNIGLEKGEIEPYWYLLNCGKEISVYTLAKELKISRSTMYGIANSLVRKGFVVWISKEKENRYLKVSSGVGLDRLILTEKRKVESYTSSISEISKYIASATQNPFETHVKYYSGVEGLEQIIWNTLSAKGDMYGYSSWDRNTLLSKTFIEQHQQEAKNRGPIDHVIVNESRVENVKQYLLQYPLKVRFLPKSKLDIKGDTYIYDNTFALTFYNDVQIFGLEIENKDFVSVQVDLFKSMWEIAEEITV